MRAFSGITLDSIVHKQEIMIKRLEKQKKKLKHPVTFSN